jgi:hypothetical protein
MEMEVPVLAGATSTAIFAMSTLPMLYKAGKTRDLSSYSLGNILLSNIGNLIHSVYVFSLPMGPIWLLHSFYLVTTGLMLIWYLQYEMDQARLRDTIQVCRQRAVEWLRDGASIAWVWAKKTILGRQLLFEVIEVSRQ